MLKERNSDLRDHQNKIFETETRSRSIESEFARMKSKLENEANLRDQAEKKNNQYENQLKEVNNITKKISEY